jgi:hypothetical protein
MNNNLLDTPRVLGAPSGPPGGSRRDNRAPPSIELPAILAWGQLAWLLAALAGWSVLLLTLPVDPDYTSGELLDHLESWRETGVLYPPLGSLPPLRVLNYPPLALGAARLLTATGLAGLAAGRIATAVGVLALVGGVAWWARARGARGAALAGTVGLLGASFPILYAAGQLHIEPWAAAGTLWGFALLDRGRGRGAAVAAGIALALGCFAKQTQVIPALAALAWAWSRRRSGALPASLAFAALGALGSGAITAAWGPEPWRHMLGYTVGTFSAANLGVQAASHLIPWLVLLALAGRLAWSERGRAPGDGALWYWVIALAWSLSAARVGSSFAYFLDLHLATALVVGPRLFGRAADAPAARARVWPWLAAAQIVGANAGAGAALAVNLARLDRFDRELPALCALVRSDPVLVTEEAGVARACGRTALFHPFILTSLAAQGRWDAGPLERSLAAGEYRAALLPFDPAAGATGVHAERWTPGMLAAFRDAPAVAPAPGGRWLVRWR